MQIYVNIWALRDKALRDDPCESFAAFYWLLITYRWSQTSWTDFSPNQLLPENISDLFLLCGGDFRSRARQRDRSCFTDVHFWTSMQIWNHRCAKRMFGDLFFHSPNEFFPNTKNLFNCKCISFPEAWITFEEIYASVFTLRDFGRRPQVCEFSEFFDRCCTMRTDIKTGKNRAKGSLKTSVTSSYRIILLKRWCYRPTKRQSPLPVGTSSTVYFSRRSTDTTNDLTDTDELLASRLNCQTPPTIFIDLSNGCQTNG